jgi:hypothetical protein
VESVVLATISLVEVGANVPDPDVLKPVTPAMELPVPIGADVETAALAVWLSKSPKAVVFHLLEEALKGTVVYPATMPLDVAMNDADEREGTRELVLEPAVGSVEKPTAPTSAPYVELDKLLEKLDSP